MKKIISVPAVLAISIIVISMLAVCSSGAAGSSSTKTEGARSGAPDVSTAAKELASSYTLQLLVANADTPVETLTFKKDDAGIISSTMECAKYGKQTIPVVYFNGEVVKFIALAGSNHDEHFYFELKFYGAFLIGEAEGGRGPIPVIAKDTKDKIYS